jgi:hypothetical protein
MKFRLSRESCPYAALLPARLKALILRDNVRIGLNETRGGVWQTYQVTYSQTGIARSNDRITLIGLLYLTPYHKL